VGARYGDDDLFFLSFVREVKSEILILRAQAVEVIKNVSKGTYSVCLC
jgi:hypothetical protein